MHQCHVLFVDKFLQILQQLSKIVLTFCNVSKVNNTYYQRSFCSVCLMLRSSSELGLVMFKLHFLYHSASFKRVPFLIVESFKNLNMYAYPYERIFNRRPFYENGVDTYFLNITLPVPVITQYVTLLVLNQTAERLLLICELQLFEGGTYYFLSTKSTHCT